MQSLRFEFHIPQGLNTEEVKEIEGLLENVKSALKIDYKTSRISQEEENMLKSQFLWNLAISKGIGIHQSKRSKSLYPQLLVFNDDIAITFYPQRRPGVEISIQDFLSGLLNGEVKCLHQTNEIEGIISGRKEIKNDADRNAYDSMESSTSKRVSY